MFGHFTTLCMKRLIRRAYYEFMGRPVDSWLPVKSLGLLNKGPQQNIYFSTFCGENTKIINHAFWKDTIAFVIFSRWGKLPLQFIYRHTYIYYISLLYIDIRIYLYLYIIKTYNIIYSLRKSNNYSLNSA